MKVTINKGSEKQINFANSIALKHEMNVGTLADLLNKAIEAKELTPEHSDLAISMLADSNFWINYCTPKGLFWDGAISYCRHQLNNIKMVNRIDEYRYILKQDRETLNYYFSR